MTADPTQPAGPFAAHGPQDLRALLDSAATGWLVCRDRPAATLLPLQPVWAADGSVAAFEGHFARRHPMVAALRASPPAMLLFLGVSGYVSPSWLQDRTQAPTWNSARLVCQTDVSFVDDPAWLTRHLGELVDRHEAGRPRAWSPAEMGPRYHTLADRLIGFRADVRQAWPCFKLGQDEREDVYADILGGFEQHAQTEMAAWMRRFNPGRGR